MKREPFGNIGSHLVGVTKDYLVQTRIKISPRLTISLDVASGYWNRSAGNPLPTALTKRVAGPDVRPVKQ
ncbi:hypothetical protein RRG08_066521 [Elysia crispata]|uniref:Uncharacterized protein n=1 Tax=Elysia crispata TaxID=231223 RepID=A0AAE0ZNL4_9GAST|nr:hypothetical protein RRG08_066521 [Elysia crispata]